ESSAKGQFEMTKADLDSMQAYRRGLKAARSYKNILGLESRITELEKEAAIATIEIEPLEKETKKWGSLLKHLLVSELTTWTEQQSNIQCQAESAHEQAKELEAKKKEAHERLQSLASALGELEALEKQWLSARQLFVARGIFQTETELTEHAIERINFQLSDCTNQLNQI